MLKPLRKVLFTVFGILPMLMPMDNARASEATEGNNEYLTSASELPWRKARLSLEAQTGSRHIGTLDVMLPFAGNDDLIVYADLMAKATTDNTFEGNLGLGFRRVNDAETSIFGMYAFYDVLKSVNENQFTQVTVGAEHLGLTWDFRANAYLPVGKTKHLHNIYDQASVQIINNNIIQHYQESEEKALYGADLEMGRTLGTNKVRGYVAAYTFGENLTGPRARVEYQINSHVALNAAVQYDQTRKTQYLLGVRFTVGGAKSSNSDSIYNRLTDPVVRDIDVVTKAKFSNATRTATDKFWMVDQTKNTSGGTGTLNDPFTTLSDAIAAAPEGAIIYVKGIDGKVYDVGNSTQLKSGQSLIGSVNDLYYDFEKNTAHLAKNSGNIFVMGGNGVAPTISGTLIANSHVGIYNLNIIASDLARDQVGITVYNAQDVTINDVNVSGFNAESGAGISVTGNSQVSFNNISTSDNYVGVNIENSQISIANTLNINQSQSVGLQMVNSQVNLDALNITSSIKNGIAAFGGTLTVKNNLTVDGGITGITAQAGAVLSADSMTINNSNVQVNAAQINIAHHLTIAAEQINLENGGSVTTDTANVTIGHMNVNQGSWSNKNGLIDINGTNGLGLQDHSNVQFGSAKISTVTVESESTLTLTDTLNIDRNVTINNATINTFNANLTNSDLIINQGEFKVSKQLTIDADATHQISLTNSAKLIADTATITTGNIVIDNASYLVKSGTAEFAHDMIVQNGAHADFGTASVMTQENIVVNGATSQLLSTGSVTAGKDIALNGGRFNGKDITTQGNVSITAGALNVTNNLTVAASETKSISVTQGGALIAANALLNTGDLTVDGNNSIIDASNAMINVHSVAISNLGQLLGKTGQLTVNGLDADSFTLSSGGQVHVAHTTVNDSDIVVTGNNSYLDTTILMVAQMAKQLQAENTPPIYQIAITEGGKITANDAQSSVAINKVILDNGIFEIKKGSLTVTNSDVDGVSLIGGSQLNVKKLTVNNSQGNGIAITNSVILANTIDANDNLSSGILVNSGTASIVVTGEVNATHNGQKKDATHENEVIGHGLDIKGGSVLFAKYTATDNFGDGINQSNGDVKISNTTLNANDYNGFSKTGGVAEIYDVDIKSNKQHGIFLDSDDANNGNDFFADGITISGNLGKGVLLAQGRMTLDNVNINNQINVSGDAAKKRELTIDKTVAGGHISAGNLQFAIDETDRAAIFVGSDAQVNINHATISDTTEGYGVWVDAGTVTLTNVVIANNKQGVVHTNGKLDIVDSIINKNSQNGIVVKDRSGAAPRLGSDRILNLTNVSLADTGKTGEAPEAGYGLAILNDAVVKFNNKGPKDYGFQITENAEGGIYLAAGELRLDGVRVADNGNVGITVATQKKSKLEVYNSEIGHDPRFAGVKRQNTGLLLEAKNSEITLENTNLINNINSGIEFNVNGSVKCLANCSVSGSQDGIKINADRVSISGLKINNNQNGIAISAKNLVLTLENYVKLDGNHGAAIYDLVDSDNLTINGSGTTEISGHTNAALNLLGKKIMLSGMLLYHNTRAIQLSNSTKVELGLDQFTIDNNVIGIQSKAAQTAISCGANCSIYRSTDTGLLLLGANNSITNLVLQNNAKGINLNASATALALNQTTLTNNTIGIALEKVNHTHLVFNNSPIVGGNIAIHLGDSINTATIDGVIIKGMKETAINLNNKDPINATSLHIKDSELTDNFVGIKVAGINPSVALTHTIIQAPTLVGGRSVAISFKEAAGATLLSKGGAVIQNYDIGVETGKGMNLIQNMMIINVHYAGVLALITNNDTRIEVANSQLMGDKLNSIGIKFDVSNQNLTYDLKVGHTGISNFRHGISSENLDNGGKIYVYNSQFENNAIAITTRNSSIWVKDTVVDKDTPLQSKNTLYTTGFRSTFGNITVQSVGFYNLSYAIESHNKLVISNIAQYSSRNFVSGLCIIVVSGLLELGAYTDIIRFPPTSHYYYTIPSGESLTLYSIGHVWTIPNSPLSW